MRPISEEARVMINLVERGSLGSEGESGDTSSRVRAGERMLTKPQSQSMGQTWIYGANSRGSDGIVP